MSKFAILNRVTGGLTTYRGHVLTHDNRAEMEYLFPGSKVIRVVDSDLDQPEMPIKQHPAMASVRWPLRREDFVHA